MCIYIYYALEKKQNKNGSGSFINQLKKSEKN